MPSKEKFQSYDFPDNHQIDLPVFGPNQPPGIHLTDDRRNILACPLDFFKVFFDENLINDIVSFTNIYGDINIDSKPSYAIPDGSWKGTHVDEIWKFIGLLLYQGLVKANRNDCYWSTKTLYHGTWAKTFLSRKRYQALLAMLHVVNPLHEDLQVKLRKVDAFIDAFREKCKRFYQPYQNVAIDERLVKSKHRSGLRQYISNKPAKCGLKLWVLADSANGYTCDFFVYTGETNEVYNNGLGYHVVMKLIAHLLHCTMVTMHFSIISIHQ